ncbi:hypothetical protein AC249_AIPGENE10624 [Exaiptasia diaphana]|nr:hypothetical protein AC249_AIPGENE10624 [Exaiptasia diaphana]
MMSHLDDVRIRIIKLKTEKKAARTEAPMKDNFEKKRLRGHPIMICENSLYMFEILGRTVQRQPEAPTQAHSLPRLSCVL